jgi:hypothetical protein
MPSIELRDRVVDLGGRRIVLREYHESHLDSIRLMWFCIGLACSLVTVVPATLMFVGS